MCGQQPERAGAVPWPDALKSLGTKAERDRDAARFHPGWGKCPTCGPWS
jgi:hypothetical protein